LNGAEFWRLLNQRDQEMNRSTLIWIVMLGVGLITENVWGQLPDESTRIYTLISGSELSDDCPICGRPTIVVPMTGTFRLRFLYQNPLVARYRVEAIAFHAGTTNGPEYWISGSGTYQIGGEVAVTQDSFLDVVIDNGFTNTSARCVNTDRTVTQLWPRIQVTADQTNGTSTTVYSLTLVAEPSLQFRAVIPDYQTTNVTLEWDSNGRQARLERAVAVVGPYIPLSDITTNQTFTDVGALTNRSFFYRLRQY
jgi:hypothetical protein